MFFLIISFLFHNILFLVNSIHPIFLIHFAIFIQIIFPYLMFFLIIHLINF